MNYELSDVQAGFRKGRGTRNQNANLHWIIQKAGEFQKKTSISALLTMPKPFTVWIPTNWKISLFISIPRKGHAKECSNYHTIELISHTSKVMLKILQARLQP